MNWIVKPISGPGESPLFCVPVDLCGNLCSIQFCWKKECGEHWCAIYIHEVDM